MKGSQEHRRIAAPGTQSATSHSCPLLADLLRWLRELELYLPPLLPEESGYEEVCRTLSQS
jgi:hypothetical protein